MRWHRRRREAEERAEEIGALVSEAARLVRETAAQVEACASCPLYLNPVLPKAV